MNIIDVKGLKKSFTKVKAVRGIDFTVKEGQLFAFIGPNGAGKSTTIDILTTLTSFDNGEVFIKGFNLKTDNNKIKNEIGVVFQENLLDKILTVKENLNIRASFYYKTKEEKEKAIEKACKETMCFSYINRKYGRLSGGQKRRVDIARALLGKPSILFLDEPTTGLDPQTRVQIWKTIRNLQSLSNMTIFLTTHYMEEAASADYCTIIDEGLIVAKGTPYELKEKYSSDHIRVKVIKEKMNIVKKYLDENSIKYSLDSKLFDIKIKSTLDSIKIIEPIIDNLENFEVLHGTMDDVFLSITGKEIRE